MKKKSYIILGSICVVLFVACLAVAFWPHDDTDPIQTMVQLPKAPAASQQEEQLPAEEEEQESKPAPYVSPVDFEEIQAMNPDIYAWIDIPDTDISYPLLQKEGKDNYYLSHDSSGEKAAAGAIFTQSTYNGKDFSDPVTLVYGHRMNSGARFGRLQETFDDLESFNSHEKVVIYLPEGELHFQVFAAVPYKSEHIMTEYDFSNKENHEKFLEVIFESKGNFREGVSATAEDKLIILSTCLKWDASKRYLVLAKLVETVGSAADAAII